MAVEALGTVAYADDLLILVEAESRRELERKGDNVLDIVHRRCGKGQLNRDPQLRIDGRLVERTKKVRYLGLLMDESRMFAYHITDVCERATTAMHRITSLVQREVRIPFRQCERVGTQAAKYKELGKSRQDPKRVPRQNDSSLQHNCYAGSHNISGSTADAARNQDHAKAQAIVGREIRTRRDVYKEIANLWQEMWSNSKKARRVYEIFPNLDRIPPYFNPTPGLVHFLTGHGPYPQYLSRFNLKDNSLCECGEEGTPEHVVLECLGYEDQADLRGRIRGKNLREIIENQDTYNRYCRKSFLRDNLWGLEQANLESKIQVLREENERLRKELKQSEQRPMPVSYAAVASKPMIRLTERDKIIEKTRQNPEHILFVTSDE
ncbi:hypothetical protein JTB14_008498 [Gonioctena quinquepunctata]|nr:hypothetical protein JTB14_008498 [Gonioctena quinquepunctata]